jgi:CRP-like cAMP-binding protein
MKSTAKDEITDKDKMLISFRKKMQSLASVSNENIEELEAVMHQKFINRGEVVLQEGQVCRIYYFIVKGCMRSFGLKEGREVNVNFYFENDTACDFDSFRKEVPSEFYMVAMEDCEVLYAVKSEAGPVWLNNLSLHELIFRFFQELYLEEEKHSNSFKLLTPEERYQYVIDCKPDYLQRIPLIHLASYLGISRETLNRIRNRR